MQCHPRRTRQTLAARRRRAQRAHHCLSSFWSRTRATLCGPLWLVAKTTMSPICTCSGLRTRATCPLQWNGRCLNMRLSMLHNQQPPLLICKVWLVKAAVRLQHNCSLPACVAVQKSLDAPAWGRFMQIMASHAAHADHYLRRACGMGRGRATQQHMRLGEAERHLVAAYRTLSAMSSALSGTMPA